TATLTKAMREAKRRTSWEKPNLTYEEAVCAFATVLIEAPAAARLREDLAVTLDRLREPARIASIAQTILQLTLPGIPDIYQGPEFWALSLVDPDTRRPPDWNLRQKVLSEDAPPPLLRDEIGASKLHLIRRVLRL